MRAAQQALLAGNLGSLQEEHILAMVAASPSWDATSGYASVEASRVAPTSHGVLTDAPLGHTQWVWGTRDQPRGSRAPPRSGAHVGRDQWLWLGGSEPRIVRLSASMPVGTPTKGATGTGTNHGDRQSGVRSIASEPLTLARSATPLELGITDPETLKSIMSGKA